MFTVHKASDKAGLSPGSLIHIGEEKEYPLRLLALEYDPAHFQEWDYAIEPGSQAPEFTLVGGVQWLHCNGVHNPETIRQIGEHYSIHSLIMEDILNTTHHPKLDETEDGIFIIAKIPFLQTDGNYTFETVNILLGTFGILSFATEQTILFQSVRERIRRASGKIRNRGADYLAYTLLDAVVDSYFKFIEEVDKQISSLEEEAVDGGEAFFINRLQAARSNVLQTNLVIKQMREMIFTLQRVDDPLLAPSTDKYFGDLKDHIIVLSDTITHMRERLVSILEIYFSVSNVRMNQIVKMLTIYAAIFMPLTFLAGVYGMNFTNMPELRHPYGYFILLGVMVTIASVMLVSFRWKKWL